MNLPAISPQTRKHLILASVLTKIFLITIWILFVSSLIDLYDFEIYYNAAQNVFHGMLPWENGVIYYYPPLALIPVLLASIGGSLLSFVILMFVLMTICDVVTTFCVYYIGLKLYSERTAFLAALLSATALSAGTFILARFDAFPTCVAMLAILFTLYGNKTKGYISCVIGLFVKIWPIILFPFLWIYNAKKTSLITEGKKQAFIILLSGVVLFGLMIAAGYNKFLVYGGKIYVNTIPYTVSYYVHLMGIQAPVGLFSNISTIIMGVIVLGSMYYLYSRPKTIRHLLVVIFISLIGIIYLSQYRSPQYIVWITPLAALLVADDIYAICAFFAVQILGIIEFPLAFWTLYVNENYTSPLAPIFFTIYFIGIALLLWQAVKPRKSERMRGK